MTTNPTLLARAGWEPIQVLKEIIEIIGDSSSLHVQVLAQDTESIEKEAYFLQGSLDIKNLYIKTPVTLDGIAAIRRLHDKGVQTTANAVFSSTQVILAGKAGANYIAPYVNRMDNAGINGTKVISDIMKMNGELSFP